MPKGQFTPKPVSGPDGKVWKGRGRKPQWLKEQEAAQVSAQPQDGQSCQTGGSCSTHSA